MKKLKQNHFKTFNIYLADVPFTDHVYEDYRNVHNKWRPVISLGMHRKNLKTHRRVLTASITTRFKSQTNTDRTDQIQRSSSYFYRIHYPKQCGLRKRSYIDTHLYRWIDPKYVHNHLGRLSFIDRYNWYRFVLSHKGAYSDIVWHFWNTFIVPRFDL